MSLSYGWGVIVFAILGVIIASYLQLIEIEYSLVIYFILAGLILIWKISQRGARE